MTEPTGPTQVVTFYSYKGGVGRTMALVNTAYVLALQGWRVLMVDFDLEAPGMTHFFAQDVRRRPAHVRKDSLDLLLDARRSLAEVDRSRSKPEYPRSLAEYVVPLALPSSWRQEPPAGIAYLEGRLDLIPATLEPGRSAEPPGERPPADYMERLQELDLARLFQPGEPGHRFGDHVRKHFVSARFEVPGDVLFALRDPVQAAYDIVLINSRTGLNEIAGFSIGTVADALVLCCGLNQQNIAGTRYFMRKAGLFDRKRAKPYIVTVGPVPAWMTREVEERLKVLRRALRLGRSTGSAVGDLLGREDGGEEGSLESAYGASRLVEIPYHPLAGLRETIFVVEVPREPISRAYVQLAGRIRSRLRSTALSAAERHFLFLQLVRSPSPTGLRTACDVVAHDLPEARLLRSRSVLIPVLPTACGVAALPEPPRANGWLHWEDLGRIPVAAAVAALRSGSAAPFERAWALLENVQPEDHRRFLARCLVYFQVATPHPLPARAHSWLAIQSGTDSRDERRVVSDVCGYIAGLRLVSLHPGRFSMESKNLPVLEEAFTEHASWRHVFGPLWRWIPRERAASDVAPRLLQGVAAMASGRLHEDSESLRALESLYHLPGPPSILLAGRPLAGASRRDFPGGAEAIASQLGSSTLEMAYDRSLYSRTPVGFWPEPLAATALAASAAPEALETILAWLYLARLHYGYAWRVLVDWRYFDAVKQQPAFQEFLRQEDEAVAATESRIDHGELPL